MAAYAADAAALLDHVGWPSARVFGISFGGMVAQEFAVTWPERVERMALLCTSPGGAGGAATRCTSLTACRPTNERRSRFGTSTRGSRQDCAELAPSDLALVEQAAEREASPMTAEQREGARLQLEARSSHDVWSRLDRIRSPTLVACGRYDGLAPAANSEAIGLADHRQHAAPLRGRPPVALQDPRAPAEIVSFLSE